MASKFFTWTKGDRREAYQSYRVDGLTPVDQYQWDSPSDVALSKKRKKRHRPKPLQLAASSSHASAVHEPAVTSATPASNLLAVVNDMLRSPAFNNPLPPPSRNPDPANGRPRSHTAPSTPSIAELPGSILLENQGFPEESKDPGSNQYDGLSLKRRTLASPLHLSASIPRAPQHKKSLSLNTATSRWGSGRTAGSSAAGAQRPSFDSRSSGHRSLREKRGDESEKSSMLRSPITELTESSGTVAFAGPESSNAPSKQPTHAPQVSENEQLKATIAAQNKKIATLKSQFHHLRISHEAHAASLVDAHRKEIDAIKTYLHYTEASDDSRPTQPHITIPSRGFPGPSPEISPSKDKGKRPSISDPDPDANEAMSKLDDAESSKRPTRERHVSDTSISSGEGEAKAEKLKRKLEMATRQLELMKDQIEILTARKDAYKDRAADLEVRVQNNHELLIDLRESEYKLEMERRLMHERHRQLKGELEALRSRPEQSHISRLEKELAQERQRANLLATRLEAAQSRTPIPDTVADLTKTIEDLKKRLEEKDEQIYELQHVNKALQLDLEELDTQQAKMAADHEEALTQESRKRKAVKERAKQTDLENTELREIVEAQGQDLITVQDEYERLRKLLHAEMRNQAKECISKIFIPGTPSSADGYLELVAAEARRRVKALIAREEGGSSDQPATDPYERIEQLEKEIQHHVNELIRCKRDNRSYKKDIKRANTKIDRMRNSMHGKDNASPQPLHRKPSLQQSVASAESPVKQKPNTAGLGISTLLPSPAISAPSSQPTSAVTGNISDSSIPSARPKTPARSNTNKKLPPYPSLPEQVSQFSSNFPPPSDPPAYPLPRDPPSRPKTPKTPTYKLTPTITRTPSANSVMPTPPSPAKATARSIPQRSYTTTCFGSDTNPSSPAVGPAPVAAAAAAATPSSQPPPQRTGTQRSLSESIISSYANTTSMTPLTLTTTNNDSITGSAPNSADPNNNNRYYRQQQQQQQQQQQRPKTPAKDNDRDSSAERRAVLAQAVVKGRAEVVDTSPNLTALPQRPRSGWKAERRSQEEKLGLVRKRSLGGEKTKKAMVVAASLRRMESQESFLKRVGSARKSLGVEGVISRFNSSRGRGAGEGMGMGMGMVEVPVMLEGGGGR